MDTPKLKADQYWKWRFYIAEMQIAEKELKFAQLQGEHMMKDLEISRLKVALFKTTLGALEEKKNLAKKDYEELKSGLEKKLGMSLNNCTIDDVTLEVRKLEENS